MEPHGPHDSDPAELFEGLFENPASFVCILTPDGCVRRVNETALGFVDRDPADVRGVPFHRTPWWEGEQRTALRSGLDRAAEGEFVRFEAEAVGSDGESAVLDVSMRPVYEGTEMVALIFEGRDVTEQAAVRRELEEARAKLAGLHEVATELGAAGTEAEVCERTVAAAEDVLELYLCYVGLVENGVIVPSATSSQAGAGYVEEMAVDEGVAGRTVRSGESQLIEEVSEDDVSEPVRQEYRSGISVPIGDFGVFQAVSAEPGGFGGDDVELAETLAAHAAESIRRLRFEESLEQENERLEEFAGVVAHDLRNPLNVIEGRIDLAREKGDPGKLDAAESAAGRMRDLIDDLLHLARMGAVVSEFERASLPALARDAWEAIDAPGATLAVDVTGTVEADANRLQELLENLFRNAVEHGGPDVTLRVGALDQAAGFYVADDGPGIPAAERDLVFESGHTTAEEGTGFGLAIVERIATAHGWTVAATGSTEGGARLEIRGAILE